MSNFIAGYIPLFDLYCLHVGLALSQFIVLRAGVFSLATAAFAGIGAYTAGIMAVNFGMHPALGVLCGTLTGMGVAIVLSIPLARLRGVYQAIATVAFI
jgi:branched-chain amino acid transport system permease protein